MDRDQFIKNVESHQRAIRRFLTALCCGDSYLADDIAQETFVKAYLAYHTLRDDIKFTSWIYRIAYTTFNSQNRKINQYVPIEEANRLRSVDDAEEAFKYEELYRALNRLSDKERYAVLLYYISGYDLKEIASITSTSLSAVKQQLMRGRQHLKNLING